MSVKTMPSFHPDQFLLADHVAGSLPGAVALTIAAHLEFCASCRREAAELQTVGATLFAGLDPVPVGEDGLARVFARIERDATMPRPSPASSPRSGAQVPRVLARFAPDGIDALRWERVTGSLRAARLPFGDSAHEVVLQHIAAGGKVPRHDHAGNEYTLVLRGGFADDYGSYRPGDFLARGPGDVHRPLALSDEDCVCLAVLDAPVRLTGFFGRLVNPFLRLNPG